MQKLKVDDEVIVLAGKDKGKMGRIIGIDFKKKRVLVSKVNIVTKTQRQEKEGQPRESFIKVERPIHISNVALMSPKTKKPTRIRIETREGKRVRVAVACGSVIKSATK